MFSVPWISLFRLQLQMYVYKKNRITNFVYEKGWKKEKVRFLLFYLQFLIWDWGMFPIPLPVCPGQQYSSTFPEDFWYLIWKFCCLVWFFDNHCSAHFDALEDKSRKGWNPQ